MLPNNPSKPKGFSGNTLRAWGYLFLLLGIAGQSIIQNRMLGLNTMTTAELFAAWDADPAIMPLVTMALVFQAMQTCAAPIFSFLLVEGILHTSNVKNYLIRVTCLALISELPYNLAMGGKLLDFSTRNPVFGLVLGMITLMFYAQYQEPTLRNRALKTVITLAALVWGKMLGIQDSFCLLLLIITFWGFRNKPNYRNLAAMIAASLCTLSSMFYLASPMSVLTLYKYNGEPGPRNRTLNYALYPVVLLCFGLLGKLI